jgi:hypothetical protein
VIDPPGPEHVRTKVLVAARAPVDRVPEAARFPAQAPLALQEVTPVVFQDKVADCPALIVVGLDCSVSVGAAATVTDAVAAADPPGPVQLRV